MTTRNPDPDRPPRSPDRARPPDAGPADWPLAPDGETWQATIEELSVAHEELRQQNEELSSATAAVEAERRRYHELFNFAPDCYLVTDPYGIIREANLAAAALFRHPPRRVAGRPLRLYVHPDRRAELDVLVTRLRAGQPVQGAETVVQSTDGLAVPVAVHARPEVDGGSRVVGLRWLLHDLTPLKEAQERAVQAERLAAVGQTVAALAHESRNALQRAQACVRLLALEVEDRPKALDYLDRLQKAQEDLTRLFEDVRTFTAPPVLERARCDLRGVWRDAWQDLSTGGRAGCVLEEDVRADVTVTADPFRLGQVFRNLFDNAVAADARVAGRPAVQVTVADNGPGLTAEQRAKLFDPFYTTKAGGMGLGLAITRRVVEAHGGTITAGDADLGGAAFTITLPRGDGDTASTNAGHDHGGRRGAS